MPACGVTICITGLPMITCTAANYEVQDFACWSVIHGAAEDRVWTA